MAEVEAVETDPAQCFWEVDTCFARRECAGLVTTRDRYGNVTYMPGDRFAVHIKGGSRVGKGKKARFVTLEVPAQIVVSAIVALLRKGGGAGGDDLIDIGQGRLNRSGLTWRPRARCCCANRTTPTARTRWHSRCPSRARMRWRSSTPIRARIAVFLYWLGSLLGPLSHPPHPLLTPPSHMIPNARAAAI